VVVIVADDLGYADVGAQGLSKDVRTPNIDSIAANGVRFTSGYVTAPVCSPTRAGLLMGRYQTRFGYEFNPGGEGVGGFGLPAEEATLAEILRGAGYRTGLMGNWHLGNVKGKSPVARGFDEFYGFWGGLHPYNRAGNPEGMNTIRKGDEPFPEKEYLTDAIGREAAGFVDRNHEKPFFLYVAFNAVHTPMQAPEKYLERFKGVEDRKRRVMLAMLSAMDDAVGGVLGKLREHKIEENTLVFFISDNGGPTEANGSGNAPLSGYKGQLFEGGIRVPFFVQWKGHGAAGRAIDRPVIALDIFATAVSLGGAKAPKGTDGVDLAPWLEGKKEGEVHERLFWRYSPQWAVREGDWKLMGLGGRAKLFDVSKDPGEKRDLAAERPEVVGRLRAAYAEWEKGMAKPMWKSDNEFGMDDVEFDRQESPHEGRERRGQKRGRAGRGVPGEEG
jgi:arylsulfatase A-like enzyme